ncbi:MAG: hypothetical protein ACI83D_000538 [Planctomycetota bacterium]|jgi:hypothetical protein
MHTHEQQKGYAIVWILIAIGIVILLIVWWSEGNSFIPVTGFDVYQDESSSFLTDDQVEYLSQRDHPSNVTTDGNTPNVDGLVTQTPQNTQGGYYMWDGSAFVLQNGGSSYTIPTVTGGGGVDDWAPEPSDAGGGQEDENIPIPPDVDDPQDPLDETTPEEVMGVPDAPIDPQIPVHDEPETVIEASIPRSILIQLIEQNPLAACTPVIVAIQVSTPVALDTFKVEQKLFTDPDQTIGIVPYLLLRDRFVLSGSELDILGRIDTCVVGGADMLAVSLWRNIPGDTVYRVEILP